MVSPASSGTGIYLAFAESEGVDNVIFRQLMGTDPATHAGPVVAWSDHHRVPIAPILAALPRSMERKERIAGYYYDVWVWRWRGIDVVFGAADLAELERRKGDGVVHELIFHPDGSLCSTWQPWDGRLGPFDGC